MSGKIQSTIVNFKFTTTTTTTTTTTFKLIFSLFLRRLSYENEIQRNALKINILYFSRFFCFVFVCFFFFLFCFVSFLFGVFFFCFFVFCTSEIRHSYEQIDNPLLKIYKQNLIHRGIIFKIVKFFHMRLHQEGQINKMIEVGDT